MDLKVQRSKCPSHPDQDESGACGACNRGICRACVAEFGYFCSAECRDETKQRVTAAERAETADSVATYQRSMRLFKLLGLAVSLCVVAGVGYVVWLKFFDPRGTVVWRWKPGKDMGMVRVLGGDEETVLLHAGGKLHRLRLKDGKVISQVDCNALDGMMEVKVLPDRIVAWGMNTFVSMDKTGENPRSISLGEVGAIDPKFNDAFETAWYLDQEFEGGTVSYRLFRVPLNGAGKPEATELKGVESARLLGVHDGQAILLQSKKERTKMGWSLRLVREGKDRRLPLSAQPDWGPELEQGWLKWRIGDTLHLASVSDGTSFTFDLPGNESFFEPAYMVRGDQLLLALPGGTVCCSLKDGKALWKSQLTVQENYLYTTRHTFVTLGSRNENVEIDMSGIGGANALPGDVLKDMGMPGGKMNRTKTIPVLAAINRDTGAVEWMHEHVRGTMVADDERVAFIMDTAVTGAIMGTEEPSLFVRQFDVDSGKEVVSRHSEEIRHIGDSTLVGRYAINVYQGNTRFGKGIAAFDVQIKAAPSQHADDDAVIVQAILLD